MKEYVDNVDAFVKVMGLEYPALIHTLALVPWKSTDDRDKFISEVSKLNMGNE